MRIEGMATKGASGSSTGKVSVVSEDGHPILLAKGCETSSVSNERPKCDDKLFPFVKRETDATYCTLNQAIVQSYSQPDHARFLNVIDAPCSHKPESPNPRAWSE